MTKFLIFWACILAAILIKSDSNLHAFSHKAVHEPENTYRYIVLECISAGEIHYFLILDARKVKFNAYVVYDFLLYEKPDYIIDKFEPIPLGQAQALFPQYHLIPQLYGF